MICIAVQTMVMELGDALESRDYRAAELQSRSSGLTTMSLIGNTTITKSVEECWSMPAVPYRRY